MQKSPRDSTPGPFCDVIHDISLNLTYCVLTHIQLFDVIIKLKQQASHDLLM